MNLIPKMEYIYPSKIVFLKIGRYVCEIEKKETSAWLNLPGNPKCSVLVPKTSLLDVLI